MPVVCLSLDPPQSESENGDVEGSSADNFPRSDEPSETSSGRDRHCNIYTYALTRWVSALPSLDISTCVFAHTFLDNEANISFGYGSLYTYPKGDKPKALDIAAKYIPRE